MQKNINFHNNFLALGEKINAKSELHGCNIQQLRLKMNYKFFFYSLEMTWSFLSFYIEIFWEQLMGLLKELGHLGECVMSIQI